MGCFRTGYETAFWLTTAYGLAEANALEQSLIVEYKDKKQTVSRMTVGQLFTEYEVYHSHETRKTSHDSVMRKLRLHVLPFLSEYRLNKLTQSVLAQWRNNIADMDCSIKQKKCIYSALNAMLNYAVKMEYIPKNPLTSLGNFKAPDTIDKHNRAFATAAELPHICIHDFRHTRASLLVNEGINVQEIARRLGHSNVQMTWNTYSHLYPREEERAVAILNKISPKINIFACFSGIFGDKKIKAAF